MKFITEYRDPELAKGLIERIKHYNGGPVRFMEFCGTHTMAIFRYGIRQMLPGAITMISGPGCPVCVTAGVDIYRAIMVAREPGVIITTFGDMMRVPAGNTSLQEEKAGGADIRIVYSALDALDIAGENPHKTVVFLGVGFETTAPTVAASIIEAQERGLKNYRVLSLHKLCPPVIRALLDLGEFRIDGFICPGHVSAVTGSRLWEFIAREYQIPCVVAGFEPLDILQALAMLTGQIERGEPRVEIAYKRGVQPEGNAKAQEIMSRIFEPVPTVWRGIGTVPASGLKIRQEYGEFDAESCFDISVSESPAEPAGCICGDVLLGLKTPQDCPLFGISCTPHSPVGPCMVSSEGTCSAYYLYGDRIGR